MEGANLRGASRNKETVNYWTPKWAVNARKNGALVSRDFTKQNMKRWGYPDGLSLQRIPKRIGRAGIIVAGGASLNWIGPHLKALSESGMDIVCGVSTISVCGHYGVKPLAAVAVDSNDVVWDEQVAEWAPWIEENQVPLILHPCVSPKLASRWPGPRWWFLPEQVGVPVFDTLPHMFPEITCRMMNAGCVANTQLEICDLLGHEVVFTAGVDFGFTDLMYGATLYHPDGSSWDRHHYLLWNNVLRRSEQGVYTSEEMLSYRTNFHLVVRLNFTQVIRLTVDGREPGILHRFPKVEVHEVVGQGWKRRSGPLLVSDEQFCKRASEYLSSQQLKIAMGDKGIQLLHFAEDDPTLIPTSKKLIEEYQQKKKKEYEAKQGAGGKVEKKGEVVQTVHIPPEKLAELINMGKEQQSEATVRPEPGHTAGQGRDVSVSQDTVEKARQISTVPIMSVSDA